MHRTGRLLAGAGGLAVASSVFVQWYSLSLADVVRAAQGQVTGHLSGVLGFVTGLTFTWSGWEGLHVFRFILLGVGVAAMLTAASSWWSPGNARGLVAGGLLAAVLAGFRIVSLPGTLDFNLAQIHFAAPVGPAASNLIHVGAGAWMAVFGGVLVMLGGWAGTREDRIPAVPTTMYQADPAPTYPADPAPTYATAQSSKPPPGL